MAIFVALFSFFYFPVYAADGSGTNIVSPTSAGIGSTANTFTFTFTAAENMDSGGVDIVAPSGFSAPQGVAGTVGYTTLASGGLIANIEDTNDATSTWIKASACFTDFAIDTTVKHEGSGSLRCSNGNEGNGNRWRKEITAQDWTGYTKVGFWIRSSISITAGDLVFGYDNNVAFGSPLEEISIGAISPDTWTYVALPLSVARASVTSYGFIIKSATTMDNSIIYVDDVLLGPGVATFPGGGIIRARILQLAAAQTITVTYGSGGGSSGVTAPSSSGVYNFTTQSRISDAGTLANIASSPTVSIDNPVPTTVNISPSSASAGGSSFTLTVNGTNFNSSSIVRWNGSNRTTVFASSTQLTATVNASDIVSAGTAAVTVFNPTPGGGTSNSQTFTITSVPDIISPTVTAFAIPATAASLTVNITSFTATDNIAVTGYLLTETSSTPSAGAAGWTTSAPTSYVFASEGSKTLYAWAKDAAGNVSTSLNASVTITLPPTPSGGTPSVSSVTTFAGGTAQSSAVFSGQVYPGSTISVFRKLVTLPEYEGTSIARSVINDDGTFEITLEYFQQADWLFALQAKDKTGRNTRLLAFSQFIKGGSIFKIENIFIPPTINLKDAAVAKGKNLSMFGYAAPNAKVEAFIDGKKIGEAQSGSDGYYLISVAVDSLDAGNYFIKTRYVLSADKMSDFSDSKAFLVSPLSYPKADFNGDNVVTVSDWSVFLYRWGSSDKKLKETVDLNGDEKIDISDFSIFLQSIKIK